MEDLSKTEVAPIQMRVIHVILRQEHYGKKAEIEQFFQKLGLPTSITFLPEIQAVEYEDESWD